MELDETDPAEWLKVEAATDEYICNNSEALNDVCERLLLHLQQSEKWSENLQSQLCTNTKSSAGNEYIRYCCYNPRKVSYSFPLNLTHYNYLVHQVKISLLWAGGVMYFLLKRCIVLIQEE